VIKQADLEKRIKLLYNRDNEEIIEYYEDKIKEIESEYHGTLQLFKYKNLEKVETCIGAQGIHNQVRNLKITNNNLLEQNIKLTEEVSVLRKFNRMKNIYKHILLKHDNVNNRYFFVKYRGNLRKEQFDNMR
jgi:hypothetical protein